MFPQSSFDVSWVLGEKYKSDTTVYALIEESYKIDVNLAIEYLEYRPGQCILHHILGHVGIG